MPTATTRPPRLTVTFRVTGGTIPPQSPVLPGRVRSGGSEVKPLDYEPPPRWGRWPTWLVFGLIPLAVAVAVCILIKLLYDG